MSVCPRGCLDPLEGVRWESWSIKNGFGIVSSPRPPVWLFGVAWCRPDWWYHLYRVTSFTPNLLWMNGRSGFHSDFTAYSCRLQLWFVFGVCELQDTCETQSAEVMLLTLTHKKKPSSDLDHLVVTVVLFPSPPLLKGWLASCSGLLCRRDPYWSLCPKAHRNIALTYGQCPSFRENRLNRL